MKTSHLLFSALMLAFIALPASVSAHGETASTNTDTSTGPTMMHSDEISGETHEQMEEYMHQMFDGDLSDQEAQEMAEIMREHHESFAPAGWNGAGMHDGTGSMMNGVSTGFTTGGMMGMSGLWGIWGWLAALTMLVWLAVGVLLAAFLIKKLKQ